MASNITSGPGFGGRGHVNETVSEQGEDGSLIMTFGIRAPGGGGGGGGVILVVCERNLSSGTASVGGGAGGSYGGSGGAGWYRVIELGVN